MTYYACEFSGLKRFLPKIFNRSFGHANINRRPRVNLVRYTNLISCRHTCFVLGREVNGVYAWHTAKTRFYSDLHSLNGDLTPHSTDKSAAEDVDVSMESVTGQSPRQRTWQVFDIDVLVSLLRQENATDICVIKVPTELMYTDYFVVVSGSSPRHLRAMAEYAVKVYKYLKRDPEPHAKIEGKDSEDWMCIDFGHMVVHFMLPETREVYELEKLWTLRSFDEQLNMIPPEILPKDFIYGTEMGANC